MEAIDTALLISLGITCDAPKEKTVEIIKEVPVPVKVEASENGNGETSQHCDSKYIAVKAQLELVQSMYSDLLKQTISSNVQN